MAAKRELIVGEVQKNKADAYRVSVKALREGPVINVALVHRFSGSELEVKGKSISLKPDQIAPMIAALQRAKDAAATAIAARSLDWLDEND